MSVRPFVTSRLLTQELMVAEVEILWKCVLSLHGGNGQPRVQNFIICLSWHIWIEAVVLNVSRQNGEKKPQVKQLNNY